VRVSCAALRPIVQAAEASLGAEQVGRVLADFSLERRVFDDLEARIPAAQSNPMLDALIEATGDPALVLHVLERAPIGVFGVVDHIVSSSETVRAVAERLARMHRLIADAMVVEWRPEARPPRLVASGTPLARMPGPIREGLFVRLVVIGRRNAERSWKPLALHVAGEPSPNTAELERIYQAPVQFHQPETALLFDPASLDITLTSADPGLAQIFERLAGRLMARMPPGPDLLSQVRHAIGSALTAHSESGPEAIAATLGWTARTLQRQLQAHRTSYKQLLDELRFELACRFLAETELRVSEIAYSLGFKELGSFHRAFRRWSGSTPSDYRGQSRRPR
jgi:AraC-like DNA-binding protein